MIMSKGHTIPHVPDRKNLTDAFETISNSLVYPLVTEINPKDTVVPDFPVLASTTRDRPSLFFNLWYSQGLYSEIVLGSIGAYLREMM